MFERYTEGAQRTLFFARYEASRVGSMSIDVEHLLLGLLYDPSVVEGVLGRAEGSMTDIRRDVESALCAERPRLSASVEIAFAPATKRVLQFAADEADALHHGHIGSQHLLLGILREDQSDAARVLIARQVTIKTARHAVAADPAAAAGHGAEVVTREDVVRIAQLVKRLSRQVPDSPENHELIVAILIGLRDLEARLRP